jgi:hypothetical protein
MKKTISFNGLRMAFSAIFVTFLIALAAGTASAQPEWIKNVLWSIANYTTDPGETNCQADYLATEPQCLVGGGRWCLMQRAIDSAKHGNYNYAFRLTLITQCHNAHAQSTIAEAGQQAVGDFLRSQ